MEAQQQRLSDTQTCQSTNDKIYASLAYPFRNAALYPSSAYKKAIANSKTGPAKLHHMIHNLPIRFS